MRVLIAGGDGWLQRSVIDALSQKGMALRRLSHDDEPVIPDMPAHVEPHYAGSNDASGLSRAPRGCDAVVLLTPVGEDGVWLEALAGAGNPRLIIVEVEGRADGAQILYGNCIARDYTGEWLRVRTAPVYGIADDPVSLFVALMRSLPVVPIVPDRHVLRPLWHRDFSHAVAAALDLPSSSWRQQVRLDGPDETTAGDLYDRLSLLLNRQPWRVPLPDALASRRMAQWHWPHADGESRPSEALTDMVDVALTPLASGLHLLIETLPEQGPWEGTGRLELKHFSAEIVGGRYDAAALTTQVRRSFKDVMPIAIGVEPAAASVQLLPGATVSMHLPGRGHVQVRVVRMTDTETVLATLQGHVVAGVVRFCAMSSVNGVRFEVTTCDAPAHWLDWLALRTAGARVQDANWRRVLTNVATLAGGEVRDVAIDQRMLEGDDAAHHEAWIAGMVAEQQGERPTADAPPPLAVVTGGSRGIGLELARCCVRAGYALLIVGRNAGYLASARHELSGTVPVDTLEADLGTAEGIDRVERALGERVPDILIANVGIALGDAFIDQSFDDVRALIHLNMTGTLDLLHRVGRRMRERRRGRMLITSSISAAIPGTFNAAYNGSKAFLTSFAAAFRREVADVGIVVTCLMPGPTETMIFDKAGMGDSRVGHQRKDDPREVAEAGFAALMHGDDAVVPGWKAHTQWLLAQITPAPILAALHKRAADPRQ